MPFLPIAGSAYTHDSLSLSAQDCINFFVTYDNENSSRPDQPSRYLQSTPGTSALDDTTKSACRGMIADDTFIYAVYDDTLYTINVSTALVVVKLARGTLNTSSGIVRMAQSRDHVVIVDGTNGYTYNKSTTAFAEITDADFNDTATTVEYVGGYFFVSKANSDQIYSSNLVDPTAWEALDFVTAERFGDKIVQLATARGELWALGTSSIEVYTDEAATTNFPFQRVEGVDLLIGCGSRDSVVNINDDIYFLDHRGFIVRARGYEVTVISTSPINHAIEKYADKTSIGYSFVDSGYEFYCLSFTEEDVTWCYNINTNQWNELKSTFDNYSPSATEPAQDNYQRRHIIQHAVKFNFLQIGGSWDDGNIYHISQDYRTDNGQPIIRQRTTQHYFNDFKSIHVGKLELQVETGVGLVSGQGSDPQIMMQYSKDRGRTWSAELFRSMGALGKYSTRLIWRRLGASKDWTIRFRVSDPVKVTLLEASWSGK